MNRDVFSIDIFDMELIKNYSQTNFNKTHNFLTNLITCKTIKIVLSKSRILNANFDQIQFLQKK